MIPVDSTSTQTYIPDPPPPPTVTPAATPPPTAQTVQAAPGEVHLSDAQVQQTASDILDVGVRLFTDDYDARMEAFAAEIDRLDDDSAARLFDEVLEQDGGALHSWLQADRLQTLNDDGRVSDVALGETVDAFAQAYTDNRVDFLQAGDFIGAYENTLMAPALVADSFQATDALLASGDQALMNEFRTEFAQDMLRERVVQSPIGGVNAMLPAAYAMHLLDQVGPTAIAETLGTFNAADRQTIYESVANGGIGYINSQGEIPGLNDPMAQLIDSVAAHDNGTMALELARFAESSNDDLFFDWSGGGYQQPLDQRAEALGNLLIGHSDTILDALTEFDTDLVGTEGRVQQVGVNGLELGNLLRLTALNPDAANAPDVMAAVTDYAGELRSDILTGTGAERESATQSLAVLGAAAQDAVNQVYVEADRAAQAQQQMADFVVDLAFSALPLGGSTIAKSAIGDVFGSQAVNDALQGFTGELIDTGTGALTDEAKAVIAEALGEDLANAQDMTVEINNLINDAVLAGLDADNASTDIRIALTALPDRIDEARNR